MNNNSSKTVSPFLKLIAVGLFLAVLSGSVAAAAQASSTPPCESLSKLKLADTTITSAELVAPGAFTAPAGSLNPFAAAALKGAPAFCRIAAEIKPTKDSNIKVEVWMPASGWNGRYQGQGNGGFAGTLNYVGMAAALARGYATATTDTGHTGAAPNASWALGHPDRIVDFGHRAVHEMTVKAKALIKTFYGKSAGHSYFAGCSNGGRQALMEAQRYPEDYDGLIAGAPAYDFTHLLTAAVWNVQALQNDSDSYIAAAKIPAISAAVLAACDAQDGLSDGLVNDPRQCRFDPSTMLCKGAETNTCLTAPQITALKKIYAGPSDSKGRSISPGFTAGGEEGPGGWASWISGSAPGKSLQFAFGTNFFSNMVFNDAAWDFKTLNFDSGPRLADEKQARNLNATDPDLKAFKARGGKLIMTHGWSDPAIPPTSAINYYNSVASLMGAANTDAFLRLFMVPGMQHCFGGPGPNFFRQFGFPAGPEDPQRDIYVALERWVEKGIPPDKIIAVKGANDFNPLQDVKMTRPLCPYPQVAKHKGSGDANDEKNFTCVAEKKP